MLYNIIIRHAITSITGYNLYAASWPPRLDGTAHDARAQAATSSTRAQTALSTGGKTEGRASRERTREDIPPTWTHTTQPARIRERRNQPSRRKHAQTRRKMKGYRQRAYAQMKGQPLTHVRSDERAPQASARPTASYPASTHEPVGPLIDKRHRLMQVQTRKPNSAAAPMRPLLRLLCDHWRSPSPTPSKPTATVRLSYLNRRLDHPSGGYPFPSPSRRRFSDDPSNESITAAHRHGIVHERISRCETLTIECRYSLFPSLQSTSCSGINLGGCPFDSRHGQDRPEERVALPEPRDSQVTDLPSQAPACSSNERSTYAASSDEFVVLRQRDLPRQPNLPPRPIRIIATVPTPPASSARLRIGPCNQSTPRYITKTGDSGGILKEDKLRSRLRTIVPLRLVNAVSNKNNMSRKGRCLSTSSWLVDPGSDLKPSAPPPDEEAASEPSPPLPLPPSTTHRDAPAPSYRSIAEIEKIMPYFDGKNMPVAQFIHDCKVAKRFLRPADHEFFIALLKARVKDGASCYLQHRIFTSDDEIYDELKRAYAPSRGLLPDLLGNLSRARRGIDEKVVDYRLRISRQLRAASDNIRENLEPTLVPGALESAAISALASFTRGLRKEVEEIVDRQNPKSLEAAINLAITAEAKIADRAAFDNDPPRNLQWVRAINPTSQSPRLCFNCNKEGHIARNCKAPRPGVICRNCNKEGHIARYCPENLNENASRQSNATATRPSQSAFRTDLSWQSARPTRHPPYLRDEVQKQIAELIDNDIVEESDSPYNSPLWIVPKKAGPNGEKKWRLVIDYRMLNEKTIAPAYPLPNITEILDQLGSSKYFSTLDLQSGFYQVPIDPSDAHKTAFSTPFHHLQFKRMPMGLKGSPSTFQALMDKVLSELQGIELFIYMDDIVVYATSLEEHKEKMNKLFGRLKNRGPHTVRPDKCFFLRKEVGYLGHIISEEGVRPDPSKVTAVRDFPRPQSRKNIKQFLGLAGYYRRFIPNFAKIASPLHILLKYDVKFIWDKAQETAFQNFKDILCSHPILQFPDFSREFIVTTDASNFALGAMLSQGKIGSDLPVAYASRALAKAELNYAAIEKELLAIVFAVQHFRPYLYGRKFTIVTDHKPLVWLHNLKSPTSRLARWKEKLRDYDYEIVHKPGRVNANADALSRNPVPISPPNPISHCADDYEHEIERRVFSINCLPEVRERESHRWLAKDGQKVDRQGELARPGGSPQGTGGTRESLREELNPGDYHRAVSSYGQEFHLGDLASPNELRCHHVSSLHADGHESHLEEFLHLERRVSHLSTPPDETSHRKRNADEMEVLTDDDKVEDKLIEGISLLPDGRIIKQHFVERRGVRMAVAKKRRKKSPEVTPPPGKLSYSRDPLLMHRDNYAHFFSVDCDTCKPLEQQLLDLNYLDLELIKTQQLNVGAITESGLSSGYSLFSLFIRNNHEETPDIDVVSEVLTNLGTALIGLGKTSISIAKSYEHLDDIYWLPIETHLEELATSLHLNITICTGEVTTPNKEDRPNIIRKAHDSAVAGHKGMIKTYHRIRERYYWPNMMEEIRRYVKTCHDCQIRKLTRVKTKFPMKITTTPTTAFEVVEMDVVGPLPITISGNKYLLTLQCNLTKYSEAIPLPDVKADMIASAFAKDFICRFGCPETLRTDMGQNLIGKVFSTLAKLFKIRQIHSTAYRLQTQGSLERSHHSLIEYLKMYINDRDWDTWIRYAIFSYNTSTHTAHGFTPHELFFARKARVPSEFANKTISKTYNDIIDDIARKLNITLKEAHDKIIEAKQKSKAYYDLKSNMRTFSPGDHVYLLKEHKTDKLDDHYTGPYLIKQLIGDRNVEIELGPSRSKIVHVDKLKHAFLRL
ncbi:unnamed protein product [Trichogramma brassicae]|uniref:RNA-directed DNA polymerase n=1 Tax=Trichogramma brassicae TaxID=86971 RepID=A0A6H5IFM5_9HYME|nr:unnamed protein product [Trichogramma brassicae]